MRVGRGLNRRFQSLLCAKLELEIEFEVRVECVNEGPAIQESCAAGQTKQPKGVRAKWLWVKCIYCWMMGRGPN
jgi:hypothetical protein